MTVRKINPLWIVLIVMPLVSVGAAFGVYLATQERPAAVVEVTAGPTPTIVSELVGQMAPNFELAALDGGTVRLSSLRGQVVFVNLWATWCEPCKREFPAFQEFEAQDNNNATILAVNQGETAEKIQTFLDEIGISGVPVLLDSDFRVGDQYDTDYFPSTFIINPAGIVAAFHVGEITLDDLNDYTAEYGATN
jgi:peroxiredoxin